MKKNEKTGEMICNVCGDNWASHTIGGNCIKPPKKPKKPKQA